MTDEKALEAIAAFKPIADIACQNLASQVILKMDGNQWCATRPDFVNLQESLAGFGNSQADAVRDLLQKYRDENIKAHNIARGAEYRLQSLQYDSRPYKPASYPDDLRAAEQAYATADERCDKLCADVAVLEVCLANLESHLSNMKELAVLDEKYG